MLKLYETGLKLIEVRIIKVDPPEQVKDAFHDVVRAREDGQKVVREAEGEAAQLIPGAEAEQLEIVAIAEAEKEQRILRSTGDAQRFTLVFDAYSNAPRITRERLYLEAVEKALATAEKVVLPPGISNQVLPWFALRRSQGDTGPGDAALPETAENSSIGKESK